MNWRLGGPQGLSGHFWMTARFYPCQKSNFTSYSK